MKRITIILLMGMILPFSGISQEIIDADTKGLHKASDVDTDIQTNRLNKADFIGWFYPTDAAAANGANFQNFVSFIFPDSTVRGLTEDDNDNPDSYFFFQHMFGSVLDPTDPNYALTEDNDFTVLSEWNPYTLDSIAFISLYRRNVDSMMKDGQMVQIIDTLSVYLFTRDQMRLGSYFQRGGIDTGVYAAPAMLDTANLSPTDFALKIDILLTPDDTTVLGENGWVSDIFNVAVEGFPEIPEGGLNALEERNLVGYMAAFKPMKPYNFGDTVMYDNVPYDVKVSNKHNYFGYRFSSNQNDGGWYRNNIYSNSFFCPSWLRYGQESENGWSSFIPGTAFNQQQFVNDFFHVNPARKFSAENLNKEGYALGSLYPNPANNGQDVVVNFALGNSGNVTLELFDISGKKIATPVNNKFFAQGENQTSFDVSLGYGVYYYKITSGNFSDTKKFFVR